MEDGKKEGVLFGTSPARKPGISSGTKIPDKGGTTNRNNGEPKTQWETPPLCHHDEEPEDLDIKTGRVQRSSRDKRR